MCWVEERRGEVREVFGAVARAADVADAVEGLALGVVGCHGWEWRGARRC